MSEITTQIEDRRRKWGNLGVRIHELDMQLQARAQAVEKELPATFTDVPVAEAAIASAKKQLADIVDARKAITVPVSARMAELMEPEKRLTSAIETASAGLLAAKKEAAAKADADAAKMDELRRMREAMSNYIVQKIGAHENAITDAVVRLFGEALDRPVPATEISAWLSIHMHKPFLLADFAVPRPNLTPKLNVTGVVDAIWSDLQQTIPSPQSFLDRFHAQLKEKFEFYEVSLKNREAALEQAKKDAEEARSVVDREVSAQKVANNLTAMASTDAVVVADTGRSLKQAWEIDMLDNEETAVAIMAAFVANLSSCKGGVRVKSYLKLSVEQMGAALCWAKKNDGNFAPARINFKSIQKL